MIRFPFSRPQLTVPKFHCARAATHHKNIATMLTTLHKNTIKSTLITHDSASFSIWIKPIVDKSLTQQQFVFISSIVDYIRNVTRSSNMNRSHDGRIVSSWHEACMAASRYCHRRILMWFYHFMHRKNRPAGLFPLSIWGARLTVTHTQPDFLHMKMFITTK